MSVVTGTAPTTYPVSLDEVKAHLNLDGISSDDNYLSQMLIPAATQWAENLTRRVFISRTLVERTRTFEAVHEFRYPPLLTVTSIEYLDTDGALQTLATSIYDVDQYSTPGRVLLAYGQAFPQIRQQENAVIYTYTAGYATIPSDVKSAILLVIGHLYENRENVTMGIKGEQLPMGAEHLLQYYKMPRGPE